MSDKFSLTMFLAASTLIVTCAGNVFAGDDEKQLNKIPPATTRKVDFVTDIQPIFLRACVRCHGPEKQKGEYRLDVRKTALEGGESYAPNIVSGKSAESPLIRFVAGSGDLVMPPEGARLTDEDVGLLRAWIDQGVHWPDELAGSLRDKRDLWSLKPLVRPDVPLDAKMIGQLSHTSQIDSFVRTKLVEHNFSSTPEADRRTLIRRISFDVIGLPPTPDEVDSFVADPDPKAYEKLVDRLLESPRYGERWARHWLDTAHFAETHGHDQDRIREHAWPYRDYLIKSFNDDKPYARFVQEQLAGDVLFPDEPAATVALGFLAAGPWDESSLRDIREDTVDRQIARYLDRDDMLANVMNNICSLTVQCARCHDHKFDPISQSDYYSLQAVFSGVERANRRYDADPSVYRQRQVLARRKRDIEQRSPEMIASLMSADIQRQVSIWEHQLGSQIAEWQVVDAESFTSSDGATLTKLSDGSILSGGIRPDKDTVTIVSVPFAAGLASRRLTPEDTDGEKTSKLPPGGGHKFEQITAIRLEVLTDDSLPQRGPGRQDNGNLHLTEFEVYADDSDKPLALINPTADFNQRDWEIAKAIDQNEPTAWGIDPKEGTSHRAVFELKEPMRLCIDASAKHSSPTSDPASSAARTANRLRFVLKQRHGRGHLIGRARLSLTAAAPPVRVGTFPDAIAETLAIPSEQRTDAQRLELVIFQQLDDVNRALSSLPDSILVYAAAADFEPDGSLRPPPGPRPIHVLHRGDIRQPREETFPGALACLESPPARFETPSGAPESSRRMALAAWLTDENNPLTWRSIVNRVWHHHFGRGLVGTLNDFGHMGEPPTHLELLDWLAVEFRDGGQSLKGLHRLIVTSDTYRQKVESQFGNRLNSDLRVTLDADNRLLWRMNRTRLDAESVRDAVLAISGRLELRMGGPSDRQFDLQPGIHVTPRVDYGKFDLDGDLGRRRSIYRFLFRTLPDPFMESFDCPSGDQITPARTNSVTVQQALALWNDVFITRHCEHIATRIERDIAGQSPDTSKRETQVRSQIDLAFRHILCRRPTATESDDLIEYSSQHGLANLCRLLLNCNEFLFVN